MSNMKYTVACNWKMLPADIVVAKKTIAFHKKLATEFPSVQIISLLPSMLVGQFTQKTGKLLYGSQDISDSLEGAFTGENSAALLKTLGGQFSIVGHSERRDRHQESNSFISKKAVAVLSVGLTPIICFGETARDEQGKYIDELERQLLEPLEAIEETKLTKVLLAYEPVWAIGKNAKRPITTDELFSTLILIKKILTTRYGKDKADKVKILYGGSVKGTNAKELVAVPGVAGFLVGGATHSKEDIKAIVQACK